MDVHFSRSVRAAHADKGPRALLEPPISVLVGVDAADVEVLSDILDDLEGKRLVNREIVNEKPVRVEYPLTEVGASLEPVIQEMAEWGNTHLTAAPDKERLITCH